MPLSRLDRFLKNPSGVILYVDPNNFDATDGIENDGTSLVRPFATIQRALIESARFSYQLGKNNDRYDRTTIVVYPGTYYIDNRPGYSIQNQSGSAVFKKKTGATTWTSTTLDPFSSSSNFNIFDSNNDLYKYNSVNGGVILPRGTSIIGLDLRKTKIRPLYVPDPQDSTVDVSSIFNVTGGCYFTAFTFFDSDPTKSIYKNYTTNLYSPSLSHHKLTAFVYADGVNNVTLGYEQTDLTDLNMYYYKVAKAYGDVSGRAIGDYPSTNDFESNIDEFRIVGALQANVLGISSIRSGNGNGTGDTKVITVTTADLQTKLPKEHGLYTDTPILISGITADPASYNGSFVVKDVVGLTTFTFTATNTPSNFLPNSTTFDNASISIETDSVSSASPYIFNCSLRSVYGLCGLLANGSKSDGFKSIVVAQYTGISLQKDDNAFLVYEDSIYKDTTDVTLSTSQKPLHTNSNSIYKPAYASYHIKATNNAFVQAVSVFSIGFANQFLAESGADMSITNSNSNFGAVSLESSGFKNTAFDRDDTGYITHIIPPKELTTGESELTWLSLDVGLTTSVGISSNLYLLGYDSLTKEPPYQIDGFRIGAKSNELLTLTNDIEEAQRKYQVPILMTVPNGIGVTAKKQYQISRVNSTNYINSSTGIVSFTTNHQLHNGESIRIFSDTGQIPDGLESDNIYYALTTGLPSNQIKIARSLNDVNSSKSITGISNDGGVITIQSSVTDKIPNELGHPIVFDTSRNNWYIKTSATNSIYTLLSTYGVNSLGTDTAATVITRTLDNRSTEDRIYKFRYVIPKEYSYARPPQAGYILQESSNVAITEYSNFYGVSVNIDNATEVRNEKIITTVSAGSISNNSQTVTLTTEVPHKFIPGDRIKVKNIRSTNNPTGVGIVSTYNGSYEILTTPSSRILTYAISGIATNPGTFTGTPNLRTTTQQKSNLALVSRESYKDNFFIYRVDTIKPHIPSISGVGQDGVYNLVILSSSTNIDSTVGYGLSSKNFNQDVRNLYPQIDRDNFNSDPSQTITHANKSIVGKVVTDDKKKSITRESLNQFIKNTKVGFQITGISVSGAGNTTVTLYTDVEHKLNSIKTVSLESSGSGYSANTDYYNAQLEDNRFEEENATCRFTTDNSGNLNNTQFNNTFKLVDSGSSYNVGDISAVLGSTTRALVKITAINNNVGDGLELSGFYSNSNLNNIFKIIEVPTTKSVKIYVPSGISTYTIPNTNGDYPLAYIASKGIGISTIRFSDIKSGIVTVTTTESHGLISGNKFSIVGSGHTVYDKAFTVDKVVGITTFIFNIGDASTNPSSTTGSILKYGISSNAKSLGRNEENLSSRASYIYAGISTTTSNSNITADSTTITLKSSGGFDRGDYVVSGSEIIRLASNPSGNSFTVLRGQFGTYAAAIPANSMVKKVKILPVEIRRPSYMKASGHTFEYLGYGPGNYSTALPQKQNKILSDDEILVSQARELGGGTIVYSGMNDIGEFYSGSKKMSSATGEETVVDAPIITYTGDDIELKSNNRSDGIFDNLIVREGITVTGGDSNNRSSHFYGPVYFGDKLTNLSDEGILTKTLTIKGTATQQKLITVGISTPTTDEIKTPSSGDISLLSNPSKNYVGHIYSKTNSKWMPWGLISNTPDILDIRIDRLGVGVGAVPGDIEGTVYDTVLKGNIFVDKLTIGDTITIDGGFTINDTTFETITINKTATFAATSGYAISVSNSSVISKLGILNVTGVSTFKESVKFEKNITGIGATFGNIRIGIISDTIDTLSSSTVLSIGNVSGITSIKGNLVAGITTINNTLKVTGFTTLTSGLSVSGILTSKDNLNLLGNIVSISTNNPFEIGSFNSTDIKLKTNNIERLRIGSAGTITSYQNNAGTELKGANLTISQAGAGDATLSWESTSLGSRPRWYAGIDVSDANSWKLASPADAVAYGNENFNNDVKLKISRTGTGSVSIDGSTITASLSGTASLSRGLIGTPSITVNAVTATTLTTTGSVGIGILTPLVDLDVYANSPQIFARNKLTTGSATIVAADGNYFDAPNPPDRYKGVIIEKFAASATGNIIGFSDSIPSANLGRLTFQNTSNALIHTNGASPLILGTVSTEAMRIDSSQRVGIGTTNPTAKLHISGNSGTLLRLDGGSGGTGTRDIVITEFNTIDYGGIIRYDSIADLFTFGTLDNSNVIKAINVKRISGDVGIGTTTPSSKLEVNGTITATTFSGNGTIPVGGIIMWSGTIAAISNLTGWALCDGTNKTPDLRERFVVGAGGINTTSPVDDGQNTNGYDVGEKNGSANATIVSHSHGGSTGLGGEHGHKYVANTNAGTTIGSDNGGIVIDNTSTNEVGPSNLAAEITGATTTGGQQIAKAPNHTHTITSEGGSATNANLPPYYALAFIIRTI